MNTTPLIPFFASSQNPTQVSTTVTGAIVACSTIIIALAAQFFHITLNATDVVSLGEGLGLMAGSVWFVVGLVHKVIQKFGKVNMVAGPGFTAQQPGV